ncbi:MAG: VWA domain-containing protein [Fimbriimonadaceae bacterium]|nr:VWA domain-containing protein [Fimbriimonadaceae bacterium]
MRFTSPATLLLLVPVALGLWLTYGRVHGMMRGRKRFAFLLRAVVAACLVLALAGPESHRANEGVCTIFVLDRSDSISDADRRREQSFVEDSLQHLGEKDAVGVVVFGREAMVDAAPSRFKELGAIASVVDRSASNLASALRLASASFPDGKARRLVVLSDGNETLGDAADAARVAAADGIEIDVVPLGSQGRAGEVLVESAELPRDVRIGQPFAVRVGVDADRATRAVVTLDRDGSIVRRETVRVDAGRSTLVLNDVVDEPGFHRYRATVEAEGDLDARNNVGMGFVAVRGKPRVLVIQGHDGPLPDVLRQQGILVDGVDAGGTPVRPEQVQPYDAVILDDVNASKITEPQMKLLRSAVRDTGVGLAMVGGEDSFLPGGWYGTPVAEALPVDLNIRQRKTFPSTSILIVCDTSGSMSMVEDGVPKVRLAAKAAEQTITLMGAQDRGGVAGSTDKIDFVAPMQKLSNKPAVIGQIQRLGTGGGGIYIMPSMEFANDNLSKEPSKVRHLILLADGADSEMQEGALALALDMRGRKITTSVVAIGDGSDVPFLRRLAAVGGGQFYLAEKAGQLPSIFTQDAAVMSRSAIEEGAFIPKMVLGEEILRGLSPEGVPPLLGYCLADARPLARVGMRTQKDDPLLAVWQFGLGSSLAFTSDAKPRWAAQWVPWGGFGKFWAQAVRAISRRASSNAYEMRAQMDGAEGKVVLEAKDPTGKPLDNLRPDVRVSSPRGGSEAVTMVQKGPGLYEGRFRANEIGSYIVTVAETDGSGATRVSSSGFSMPYPPEYRAYRANRPMLEGLARAGGGRALAEPREALRPVAVPGESIQELWAAFLFAAAILLPLDVAARRVAIPFGEMWAALASRLRALRLREREDVVPQVEVAGRLQSAKARAKREVSVPEVEAPIVKSEPRKPEGSPAPSGGDAAARLLDAKRRRKGD